MKLLILKNYHNQYSIIGLNYNKDYIVDKIQLELKKLRFKLSYNGTRFLIDCIYNAYLIKEKVNINLSKDIFPILAKKYNKSINTIHGDIKSSINSMYYDCDSTILKEYFNYYQIEKPKLKELIFTVISKIE